MGKCVLDWRGSLGPHFSDPECHVKAEWTRWYSEDGAKLNPLLTFCVTLAKLLNLLQH